MPLHKKLVPQLLPKHPRLRYKPVLVTDWIFQKEFQYQIGKELPYEKYNPKEMAIEELKKLNMEIFIS